MTSPTSIEALRAAVEWLERHYDAVRHLLTVQAKAHAETFGEDPTWQPEHERDHGGRFILLDTLTAIVNARTALAQHDRTEAP